MTIMLSQHHIFLKKYDDMNFVSKMLMFCSGLMFFSACMELFVFKYYEWLNLGHLQGYYLFGAYVPWYGLMALWLAIGTLLFLVAFRVKRDNE